jgi:cbb3-type cytochrome oxidase subunit 3
MSASGLQLFAEIGLVMFLAIFAGVLAYTFAPGNRSRFERSKQLPFDEDRVEAGDRGDQR